MYKSLFEYHRLLKAITLITFWAYFIKPVLMLVRLCTRVEPQDLQQLLSVLQLSI